MMMNDKVMADCSENVDSCLPEDIDGRPLHAYRLNECAFGQCERALCAMLSNKRYLSASAAFVLWGSERYRRDFDGGAFSWSFLTEPLGADVDHAELREMTRHGLAYFKRPPPRRTEAGNTQYLRTIAAEGGIPVRLLSGQGGYRAALVGLVADLGRFGLGCPQDQAMAFTAKRTARLPIGYRTEEFRELFLAFAREVLELRANAPDTLSGTQVEAWLDQERPGWRNDLSLRLDEDSARSLLSEAVAVTRQTGLEAEPIKRVLSRESDGQWSTWIEVEDEAHLDAKFLQGIEEGRSRLRLGPAGDLASEVPDLLLTLDRDPEGGRWTCKRISGRRTASFRYPLDRAASFTAMADGRYLSRIDLSGGAAVGSDQGLSLWLLSEMGAEQAEKLQFAGTASLTTQDPHVWVLTPSGTMPRFEGELVTLPDGQVDAGDLWCLSGKGRVFVSDWNVSVETNAERTDRDEIVALGAMETTVLDNRGAPVYRGFPNVLHRRAGRHFKSLNPREMRFRPNRRQVWQSRPPETPFLGPLSIAVREGQGIGPRVSANILPEHAIVRDISHPGQGGLTVELDGFPPGWTVRIADGPIGHTNERGRAVLELPPEARLKGLLPFAMAGPEGSQPLAWSLVLPRRRADFLDDKGNLLVTETDITLHDLRSWRIFPAQDTITYLRIRLVGDGARNAPAIAIPVSGEIALSSFRSMLEDVLALGGPDAEIRLRVLSGPDQSQRLVLRRYAGEAVLKGASVSVSDHGENGSITDIEVLAVNMRDPEKVLSVPPNDLSVLPEGRWFLLPNAGGHPLRPPRPFISRIAKPFDMPAAATLPKTREERIETYAKSFSEGIDEYRLKGFSKLIGAFFEHDASPSSLDQVLALQRQPSIAIRLLFRAGPQDVSGFLSLEVHGGPRWVFITPEEWGKAVKQEFESLQDQFRKTPTLADMATDLARKQLSARTQEILALRPDLTGHLAIGLLAAGLAMPQDWPAWLGTVPKEFADPQNALLEHANHMAQRHAELDRPLHDLRARDVPEGFTNFHEDILGLIEAPLFAAEVAYGVRSRPTTREMMELLQAIHIDPGAFETAMPAAMAWHFSRQAA